LNAIRALPALIAFLLDRDAGAAYGVGVRKKLGLVRKVNANVRALAALSSSVEHLEMVRTILRLPRATPGDIVECGSYVGGSAVNLSLACALVGRRLVVCDSFEGLPDPAAYDREHATASLGQSIKYYEGRFAAPLELVRANLARYGDLSVCDFVVGYFEQTMPTLDRAVAMAFLDVDLIDSVKPCLQGIWPNLAPGCKVYVHEAQSIPLVSVFFDSDWWETTLGVPAPGFVGGGSGLPLVAMEGSRLGYAQRRA
jgi:hypothetical protein